MTTTAFRCPRCGLNLSHAPVEVCTPCEADMGWNPPCEACLTEQRGGDAAGMVHVDTCGGGKRASTDLSPRARAELAYLARVEGPRKAEAVLIAHQRLDVGSCLCGWAELGKSHAGHQVAMLSAAGVLREVTA